MPLTAHLDGQRVISVLLTPDEWTQLKDDVQRKRKPLTLPCGSAGHARTSKLGTPHFAHNPGGDACSAGETKEHLLAKEHIIKGIVAAGWEAHPEHRHPDGAWVADVLATDGTTKVVFEVQWSPQSLSEYKARTARYKRDEIKSVAWFARRMEGLPRADKALPVFGLTVDDSEPVAHIGPHERDTTPVALADAVERLLTRRLQHRDYIANRQPSQRHLQVACLPCWKCERVYGVWQATATQVTGNCGTTHTTHLPQPLFQTSRPETDPALRRKAEQACRTRGWTPARLGLRTTQASGTRYMAFICPHCNTTSGDMYVNDLFDRRHCEPDATIDGPPEAAHKPHWCLATEHDTCTPAPVAVIEAPQPEHRTEGTTNVRVQTIGVNDIIRTMFRT